MFEGYLTFAGNEVINVARTQAYIDSGYVPPGTTVDVCESCDGLEELLDEKYASPLVDEAPWYESGNPDTWDFAGVIPLEMTGATGSTRTATVTDLVGDGGAISGLRFKARTIAFTALLVGKTGCSVEAGLSWLSQTLGGSSCTGPRPGAANACAGDEMCMFTCCPGEVSEAPIPGAPQTDSVDFQRWTPTGGSFDALNGAWTSDALAPGTWTNLIRNPSFENVDTPLFGWTPLAGNTAALDVVGDNWPSRHGDRSLRVTGAGGTAGVQAPLPMLTPADTGKVLNIAVAVGTSFASGAQQVAVTVGTVGIFNGVSPTRTVLLNVNSYGVARLSVPITASNAGIAGALQIQVRSVSLAPLPVGAVAYLDAAIATADVGERTASYFDGNTNDAPGVTYEWTGAPNASTSTLVVDAVQQMLTGTPVPCWEAAVFDFGVASVRGPVTVIPQALDLDGNLLWEGAQVTVSGTTPPVRITPDMDWGTWVPRLLVLSTTPFTVDPTITHDRYRTAEECADLITRSYLDVVTVDGPNVVEKIALDCGEFFYRVEWTMVAANPMLLGAIEPLVTSMWAENAGIPPAPFANAFSTALGVTTGRTDDVFLTETECRDTVDVSPLAVFDPCCPGFIAPPTLPYVADSCFDLPTAFERTWVQIPRDYAPQVEDGLLSLTILNDGKNKRGLRVRVYPDPVGNGVDGLVECDFCDEFFVTYIPANATWRVDNANKRITTQLGGSTTPVVSSASVRGKSGGPFTFPVMQCNMGYLIVIDVPVAYMDNCGSDCAGDPQGSVLVSVEMRRATL